jgi:hypothetical protein
MTMNMGTIGVATALALSLATGGAIAASDAPMTPELAAKSQMVRKQEEQRISRPKQKAAAEALKAERIRVYNAKQAVQRINRDNSGSTEKPVH